MFVIDLQQQIKHVRFNINLDQVYKKACRRFPERLHFGV